MHLVLHIPELVLKILAHLSTSDKLRFGQTCRNLWSLSVPLIWTAVNGEALNSLLPTELRVYDSKPHKSSIVVPAATPLLSPFIPLLNCTAHVRHLSVTDSVREHASHGGHDVTLETLVDAMCSIAEYTNSAMLPRLESVDAQLSSHLSLEPAIRLFSPGLKYLKVKVHIWQTAKPSKIASLVESVAHCSSLIGLDMDVSAMGFSREVLDSVLTRVVVGLKFLRMFQCRGSTELLAAVAQCRDLELFVIDGYEFGHEHTTPYGQSQAPFSKLRSFGINSIIPLTGSAVFSVLGAITSPSLVELQLQFQGREPGLVEAVSTLVADKWAGSLMKISFRFDITNPEDDVFGGIQPLLRCSRLEYLFLATGTRLNFLDGTYHALSLAWPNLSALSIRSEPENTPIAWVPPATWHTLQILSQNCPKLRHICIPVNFDAFCSQPGEKPQVPSTSVRTLDAAVSICSHPHSTAERLRKLFPALTALCYKDACLKEVRELLGLPVQCGNINEQEIHGVRVTFPFCEAAE